MSLENSDFLKSNKIIETGLLASLCCLFVRPSVKFFCHLIGFYEIYLKYFSTICQKILQLLKSEKTTGTFLWN